MLPLPSEGEGWGEGDFQMKTLIAILLLVAGISHRAPAFHDEIAKVKCLDCHSTLPFPGAALSFRRQAREVCAQCHRKGMGSAARLSHPIDVVPSMAIPPDMPLDEQGRMTCVTCHTYHTGYRDENGNKRYFLRRPQGKTFCYACHDKI